MQQIPKMFHPIIRGNLPWIIDLNDMQVPRIHSPRSPSLAGTTPQLRQSMCGSPGVPEEGPGSAVIPATNA